MALLTIKQTAARLLCSSGLLYNRPFRAKLGLRAVKIGAAVRFDERDIEEVIQRRKETFP